MYHNKPKRFQSYCGSGVYHVYLTDIVCINLKIYN